MTIFFIFAVVPDDDQLSQHGQDNIPPRSCFDVHGALEDDKVQRLSWYVLLVYIITIRIIINIITIVTIIDVIVIIKMGRL